MTNTNEPPAERPRIFFDEMKPTAANDSNTSPPGRSGGRRSTKGERYETSRVEKGITRRVRRDGTGKPAYEVQVWVNGRALSRTLRTLSDARRWRDEMLGSRATGDAKIPSDRRITVARFVATVWSPWLDEEQRFGNLRPSTVAWYKDGAKRLVAEIGRVKVAAVGKRELRGMLARRGAGHPHDGSVRVHGRTQRPACPATSHRRPQGVESPRSPDVPAACPR